MNAKAVAAEIARGLLRIGAVHFNAQTPYTLASGLPAPTYVDCRKVIGDPALRTLAMDAMAAQVRAFPAENQVDLIAGGETAGIPFAAFLAERLDLPMCYVRKKPKGYGRNARIEGALPEGRRVLLVEDLATDGGSKLSFTEALREAGGTCTDIAVLFFYGIFPGAEARLAAAGLRLHALCTWRDVLAVAKAEARFDARTLAEVESFLNAPEAWQAARGAK